MKLILKVTTPDRTLINTEVDQVTVPTKEGEITILPGHVSLMGVLAPGELSMKNDAKEEAVVVYGGFVDIRDGREVRILADEAAHLAELDLEKAEAAHAAAVQAMAEKFNPSDYEDAALAVERESATIRVARKWKAKGFGTSTVTGGVPGAQRKS